MSKWDEQILVVNRKDIFNNEENHFYGFLPREDEKVKKIVDTFTSYEVKRRGDMEEDNSYKQLIGYVVIKDRNTKEILVYKRLVGGGEARLHGKASVGIGGHMNEVEGKTIFVCHGDKYGVKYGLMEIEEKAKSVCADIVIFGHTHIPLCIERDGILYLNPGSISLPRGGSSRRFVIMDIQENRINLEEVII